MNSTEAKEVHRLAAAEEAAKVRFENAMNGTDSDAMKRAADDYQKASDAFAAYVVPCIRPYSDRD